MRRRRTFADGLRAAALAAWVLTGAAGPAAAAPLEPTPPERLYVRRPGSIRGAADAALSFAKGLGAPKVVVVFERSTFGPPPGDHEFRDGHDYAGDLGDWVEAFGAAGAASGLEVRVGSTISDRWTDARATGALDAVLADFARQSWTAPGTPALPSASRWVERALARNDVPSAALVPAGRAAAALVFVASERLPEDAAPGSRARRGRQDPWRSLLAAPGTSFDEEAVSARLAAAACPLVVVAPEVRFLDEVALPTLPAAPWASRPSVLSLPSLELLDPPFPRPPPGPDAPRTPSDVPSFPRVRVGPPVVEGRFAALTPFWRTRARLDGRLAFPTDSPSGYGYWPFARAAARSGGRYVFYPFPAGEFRDVCPSDPHLLADLTPELVARTRWPARVAADDATRALLEAQRMVLDVTPWDEAWPASPRRADAWAAFTQAGPPVAADRWAPRRFPFDVILPAGVSPSSIADVERVGERLERETLPRYEVALARLDAAVEAMRDGVGPPPPLRAQADLLLGRCWFAMSAFHLHALAIYLREIRAFFPPGTPPEPTELVVTYVPAIRLSDVLEAYDGRAMPARYETTKQVPLRPAVPRWQSNVLALDVADPAYRALRPWDRVVERLDPRLLRDATRVRDTAAAVMRRFGRAPHGWVTYYAEVCTFVWDPVRADRTMQYRWGPIGVPPATTPPDAGGATTPDDDPLPTPPGGTPRPGSGSGGPTTK